MDTRPVGIHDLGRALGYTGRRPFGIHGQLGYTVWDVHWDTLGDSHLGYTVWDVHYHGLVG